MFILRECQTLIWKPQNSRRRRPTRGQRPKELADISNAVATPEGQQTQHVRNYHDEEKTLKHQLFLIRTWDFLPALLALNGPGAPLLGSSYSHRTVQLEPLLPVRAHLYVTNFTRGAQVWSGIRVKLGPEHGSKIGVRFRDIFYPNNAFSTALTKLLDDSNMLPFSHPNCSP